MLDPKTPSTRELNAMTPSAYWGEEPIWTAQADNHNPMMDEKGHLWFTVRVRPPANNPAFCRQGSEHPSAKVFPLNTSTRQTSMYDPAAGKFTLIDLCFPTHHLIFGEDADNTLWFSSGVGGLNVAGWLNRRVFEQTGDHQRSAGLVAVRARHQRQRAARRRLGAAQPAGRSGEGQARRRELLQRGRQSAGRHRSGARR